MFSRRGRGRKGVFGESGNFGWGGGQFFFSGPKHPPSRGISKEYLCAHRVQSTQYLGRFVLVPLRHLPTGHVSYWLCFVQVGPSVAFGHGAADSCGH